MPPKQKPVTELGAIHQSGNSFRAHVKLGSKRIDGPSRSSKEEAEADLANARGAGSRDAFAQYLASLSRPPENPATLPLEGGHASASAPATEPALDREPALRGALLQAARTQWVAIAEDKRPPLPEPPKVTGTSCMRGRSVVSASCRRAARVLRQGRFPR